MNYSSQPRSLTLGLFEKRIEGDDCLMELARRRFQQAGMGAEMHAGTPEQLYGLMKFRPSEEAPVVVHLAVHAAPATVLDVVENLGALGKPVHFHLHDAHPLSTFSPFGVSDHLSFLAEIPLRFDYPGRRSLPLMFGPPGLGRIVAKAT